MNTASEKKVLSLWLLAAIALVASTAANLIVLSLTKPLNPTLMSLAVGPVISWSIFGTLGATIVFVLVRRARRRFLWISGIVLVLSFIPDIALLFVKESMFGQANAAGVLSLMAMHVVSAAIIVPLLLRAAKD